MEEDYKIQEVVEALKKGLFKEKGIKIVKIRSTSFSMKRKYLKKNNTYVTLYSFKFNGNEYSDFSHNYVSPFRFLKDFYNKKVDFDEIKFPPEDTFHQFVILNIKSRFYLILGYGNGKFIKAYELTNKKLLEFIEKIAIQHLADIKDYWKKYPDLYKEYIKKCNGVIGCMNIDFAEKVLRLIKSYKRNK